MVERFNGQRYEKLRKHHQELGVPWTDTTFAASETSIGIGKSKSLPRNVQWKRPHDLCESPKLFVDGASHHDVTQGKLGNCWFVAACSVLAGVRPIWEKVIPDAEDQGWMSENYSGVFRFRFWQFGTWIEVVVDDLLPTVDGELIFIRSPENTEFWGALLEKAYAKLHGSYEALDGGNISDALVDFTGGVSQVLEIGKMCDKLLEDHEKKKELFKTLMTEMEDHSLMCCAIRASSDEEMEQRTDFGLVKGHAYGITALKKVPIGGTGLMTLFKGREKLYMVRLQNPWRQKEWTGPFSDGSPEWSNITEKEREKLGLTFNDDGEFWMPFDDFIVQFSEMSICRLPNTSFFSLSKTWHEERITGAWTVGVQGSKTDRAGGCLNHPDTFLRNPQYRFDITNEEDDVIIQLSQKPPSSRLIQKNELLVIGFHVMKVEANRKYRIHKVQSGHCTSDYIRTKHIFHRCKFPRGRFVLVPTAFNPEEKGEFLIRIFTGADPKPVEMTEEEPKLSWWQCCAKPPVLVTRVTVKGAEGLEKQDTFGTADPYCVMKCEGKKVHTPTASDTLAPTWETSAVFYRKDPLKPIKLQVWNSNMVMDSFMGQALLAASATSSDLQSHIVNLVGRKSKKTETVPGSITVEVETYDDLKKL